MKFYLFGFYFSIGKNYAFEADFLRRVKLFREPSFNFALECELHDKDDHCPKVNFEIIVLWWKLVELSLYNTNHREHEFDMGS